MFIRLDDIMEFDHVIEVHPDGTVTNGPKGVYGPEAVFDGKIENSEWTLMSGYTKQYGYRGPVMHDSEYIGGWLAQSILSEPGLYVAIVAYYTCDGSSCDGGCDSDAEDDHGFVQEGWAVARREPIQ